MTTKRILFLFKQLLDATAVGSILVLRRAVVFAILLDLILPQLLVGQGSPLSSESKWIAKILNASRRDSVIIRKPNQDQRNEKSSEGQQWLVLRVE
jgi:hypothetical protein